MTTSATTSSKTTSPGEEEYLISRVAIIYYLRFPFPLFFYNDNKKMRHTGNQEKVAHKLDFKKSTKVSLRKAQTLHVLHKDLIN